MKNVKEKLNDIKKSMQWIMIITKQNPELFHDGIDLEISDVAKDVIKQIDQIKKEIK